VNAGAEGIAEGDILVFGTLRGLAHAGSRGDEKSRIVAGNMRPQQIRIAGKIARSPEDSNPTPGARNPEIARIVNGEIQVSPA
jgi:septum site-determining protein MinC